MYDTCASMQQLNSALCGNDSITCFSSPLNQVEHVKYWSRRRRGSISISHPRCLPPTTSQSPPIIVAMVNNQQGKRPHDEVGEAAGDQRPAKRTR